MQAKSTIIILSIKFARYDLTKDGGGSEKVPWGVAVIPAPMMDILTI
jgi:hypothetical protein